MACPSLSQRSCVGGQTQLAMQSVITAKFSSSFEPFAKAPSRAQKSHKLVGSRPSLIGRSLLRRGLMLRSPAVSRTRDSVDGLSSGIVVLALTLRPEVSSHRRACRDHSGIVRVRGGVCAIGATTLSQSPARGPDIPSLPSRSDMSIGLIFHATPNAVGAWLTRACDGLSAHLSKVMVLSSV